MVAGAGDVRAGGAYVEITADDKTARGLASAQARLRDFARQAPGRFGGADILAGPGGLGRQMDQISQMAGRMPGVGKLFAGFGTFAAMHMIGAGLEEATQALIRFRTGAQSAQAALGDVALSIINAIPLVGRFSAVAGEFLAEASTGLGAAKAKLEAFTAEQAKTERFYKSFTDILLRGEESLAAGRFAAASAGADEAGQRRLRILEDHRLALGRVAKEQERLNQLLEENKDRQADPVVQQAIKGAEALADALRRQADATRDAALARLAAEPGEKRAESVAKALEKLGEMREGIGRSWESIELMNLKGLGATKEELEKAKTLLLGPLIPGTEGERIAEEGIVGRRAGFDREAQLKRVGEGLRDSLKGPNEILAERIGQLRQLTEGVAGFQLSRAEAAELARRWEKELFGGPGAAETAGQFGGGQTWGMGLGSTIGQKLDKMNVTNEKILNELKRGGPIAFH